MIADFLHCRDVAIVVVVVVCRYVVMVFTETALLIESKFINCRH